MRSDLMWHARYEALVSRIKLLTGKAPLAISYPYGAWTPELVDIAVGAGIRLGFTTAGGKARVSWAGDPRRRMLLGRFGL